MAIVAGQAAVVAARPPRFRLGEQQRFMLLLLTADATRDPAPAYRS